MRWACIRTFRCAAYNDEWLQPKRMHYRQQLSPALAGLVALLELRREFSMAIVYADRLAALDPLREAHHQSLIRLHSANEDRALKATPA